MRFENKINRLNKELNFNRHHKNLFFNVIKVKILNKVKKTYTCIIIKLYLVMKIAKFQVAK